MLVRDEREVASWPLEADGRPGMVLIDWLARLQLTARRMGCSIRLRGACPELVGLLDLAGLASVLRRDDRLVVEVGGQPEGGEQPSVEEVVMPDDPAV